MTTDILGKLSEAYNGFLKENNLDNVCAEELIAANKLTSYERQWVSAFITLWDIQSKQM